MNTEDKRWKKKKRRLKDKHEVREIMKVINSQGEID